MLVSVSILKEYDRLINAVRKVNESKCDYLHIDVMDGKFVSNTKFPIEVVKDVISISKKKTDVHLMVEDINLVKEYALLKPDIITFHSEIIKDRNIIDYIKDLGVKVGLAVNPLTNIDKLLEYQEDLDIVLFMSVNPGEGGQSFIPSVLDKIKEFKSKCTRNIIISIDGGVNDQTVSLCKEAGCNMVVSGSFITNSLNYNEQINKLK